MIIIIELMKLKIIQTDGEVYHVLDWRNQYCENDSTIQSNLQIQSNLYQNTNVIFYRTRTKNLKICDFT